MSRYLLRVENLPKYTTRSDVRECLDGPPSDVIERMDILENASTSTAMLVVTNSDFAFDYLNMKEPKIGGNRVTFIPQLVEEMSITLNGSWLREIERKNPRIRAEIADTYKLKLYPSDYKDGVAQTISLTGVPYGIKQAKAMLDFKIQEIIKNRGSNVPNFEPTATHSAGNKTWDQSRNVDNMHTTGEHGNLGLKSSDRQTSLDANSDVESKKSQEIDNPNPGKQPKRARILKTGDAKSEKADDVAHQSERDVDVNLPKEGKRSRVLVQKPGNTQSSESSGDPLVKPNDVDYQTANLYKAKITVHKDTHRYLLEHSKMLNFSDSSMGQFQVSEDHIDWVIGNNNEKNLKSDKEDLQRLIDGLRKKPYLVPIDFDFDVFKNFIEAINENKKVSFSFDPKARNCNIVGPPDEVDRTLKWICDTAIENFKRSSQKRDDYSASGDAKTYDKEIVKQVGEPQSGSTLTSDNSGHGKKGKFNPLLDSKQRPTKTGDGIHISSKSSKDRMQFTTRGKLTVSVYQGNMIKQPTEVIVNPANDQLAHGGGLARVILDAGGQIIDDESRQIISNQGKLQTSEVVHTSAGKLPHPIRYVIHAVGPTAYEFKDNKAGLVPTLKVTFQNCLEYANKLGVASISLPPISSGIFAVPIPDIIQGAVEAIQDFDRKYPSSTLKEVHFISNDAKTTEEMISCFRNVIG